MSVQKFLIAISMLVGSLLAGTHVSENMPSETAPHDHSAHAHRHEQQGHGESPLEEKLRQKIEKTLGFEIEGHEVGEGPTIRGNLEEHTQASGRAQACPDSAPLKYYDVVSIEIEMVLNRWGDRDPHAYMFALRSQIPAIRAQEALADDEAKGFGLTLGLGGDPIQPLTIRANVGDCVRVQLTNQLSEPTSFHVHGADFILTETGEPALSSNPLSMALPLETVEYEWFVASSYYGENTHYLHSHGPKSRFQVSHGLFGALIVEPAGSVYFDQRTGEPLCGDLGNASQGGRNASGDLVCRNSWDAIISPGDGSSDFREFAMFYHEVGNARFLTVDKDGLPNPSIDPISQSYKPNGRAINYRSESFWRRLGEQEEAVGFGDESQAYGTYAFGEPATPVPQSYLGDPAKFRLIHGGSETFHVPHLHGGGDQWQRQQDVGKGTDPDYTPIDAGLKKTFNSRMPSSGNDAQTIGPSETYELEIPCGSGACQQNAGDFLFHCHVASHYISGMWHFWRVYNTLQTTQDSLDPLMQLAELPDRRGGTKLAVTSEELLGTTVDYASGETEVTPESLTTIVESQLPPQGVPNHELDAAVFNWAKEGNLYLNEPETSLIWPNFESEQPGQRPALRFDPVTGKLAYPFLRPHLGQRPPFAPHHGPAPFLEPLNHERGEPAPPGTNGKYSLCPEGAPQRTFKIHAIQTEVPVTSDITDPDGMIFVLKENEALARSNPEFKVPLAIRANQGDCVDVILVNELEVTGDPAELSKTNIHIHFVQFDTQASDGVISGAQYEQSPRPFIDPGMSFTIQERVTKGSNRIRMDDASSFHVGSTVAIGIDQDTDRFETAIIVDIQGNELFLEQPLKNNHEQGELVSVEFVRYRWYVARQNGAIYYHDHVDAAIRWGHGLFGAIIAEPTGATYHHPVTGEEIRSGPIADIHVDPNREVLPDLKGSFREFVLFMNDGNPYTGSSFNLRAEPLRADTARGQGPPELAFSSVMHGDPHTPLLRAYAGDPMIFRLLTSATEEIHPFHITGHTFRQERFIPNSPEMTHFGIGISERFNAHVVAAGGESQSPGDYLYYNGAERHFREGSWGILRVHDRLQSDLKPLPGSLVIPGRGFPELTETGETPPKARRSGNPCPVTAPLKSYNVSAIEMELMFNEEAALMIPTGRMYVLDEDMDAVLSGRKRPEPLVIRANAGDCLSITLTNRMSNQPASINLDAMTFDPQGSLGITIGFNPDQTVQPGESITYRYFTGKELGTVLMRDFGNVFRNAREGLYGAVIIEPKGSTYVNPITGSELRSGVEAMIENPNMPDFREFVAVMQDNDPDIGLFLMPYDEEVNRLVGVNYRSSPLSLRLSQFDVIRDQDPLMGSNAAFQASAIFNSQAYGDPDTHMFDSFVGDPVRFRVANAYSEQPQVFFVEGHEWMLTPQIPGSDVVSARYVPPTGVLNIELMTSGGPQLRSGDYQWGNHRLPYEKAGQWGMMRLFSTNDEVDFLPLSDRNFTTNAKVLSEPNQDQRDFISTKNVLAIDFNHVFASPEI